MKSALFLQGLVTTKHVFKSKIRIQNLHFRKILTWTSACIMKIRDGIAPQISYLFKWILDGSLGAIHTKINPITVLKKEFAFRTNFKIYNLFQLHFFFFLNTTQPFWYLLTAAMFELMFLPASLKPVAVKKKKKCYQLLKT